MITTEEGLDRLEEIAPDLKVVYGKKIHTKSKIFHPDNSSFTMDEKAVIRKYCMIAEPTSPTGYGNIQSLVVFYHRIADNVFPILNSRTEGVWEPLFPRENRSIAKPGIPK
jgi:hypothetical protein